MGWSRRVRDGGTSASRRAVAGTSVGAIIAASLVLLPAAGAEASPVPKTMTGSERAAVSGELVEVTDQRAEYSQTFANPDGTFTLEHSLHLVVLPDSRTKPRPRAGAGPV